VKAADSDCPLRKRPHDARAVPLVCMRNKGVPASSSATDKDAIHDLGARGVCLM
jgi:hypothetical protein